MPQGHRLLPDVLTLPVPPEGWAVLGQPGRLLVRLSDGTGFATAADNAVALWTMAGTPPVQSCGGPLPEGLAVAGTLPMPDAPDPALARFDLMAGMRPSGGLLLPRGWRLALAVAAAFLLGHLLIATADMIALSRLQSAHETKLRAALSAAGQPVGDDLTASLNQALSASGAAPASGFLDLAVQVFAAMADQAGQVTLSELRYGQDSIVMTLEAADLAALQQIEARLSDAGLTVQAGAATTRDGAAEVQMTVTRGPT